jgi:FAD/FMN-containing dehydrogenase
LRELGTPLLDLSHATPYAQLQNGFDWAYPKGWYYYWKSLYLNGLEGDALEAFIQAGRERPTHQSSVSLWALGGAPGRVPAAATAFGKRDAPFLMTLETTWTDPADTERSTAWSREKWAAMQRFSDGGLYLNFAGFGEEKEALVRAGYGENYDRLAALKARYDPGNLFRMNQNIKPA